jgi:hypothetical protein
MPISSVAQRGADLADDITMTADQLCPCGLKQASSEPRCQACPVTAGGAWAAQPAAAPIGRFAGTQITAGSDSSAVFDPGYETQQRTTDHDVRGPLMTYSRWKKSEGTFGPAGRVIATLLLLLPLVVMVAAIATGIGIVGAVIYIFAVMPWALRDIWQKAPTVIQPPRPTGVRPRF